MFEFDLDINIKTEAKKKIKIEKSVVNPFALKTIFKKENKSPENTVKVERKPIIAPKIKTNEPAQPKSKCTIFNVNYKTFQIKKCTIQIEKCEELETAK